MQAILLWCGRKAKRSYASSRFSLFSPDASTKLNRDYSLPCETLQRSDLLLLWATWIWRLNDNTFSQNPGFLFPKSIIKRKRPRNAQYVLSFNLRMWSLYQPDNKLDIPVGKSLKASRWWKNTSIITHRPKIYVLNFGSSCVTRKRLDLVCHII